MNRLAELRRAADDLAALLADAEAEAERAADLGVWVDRRALARLRDLVERARAAAGKAAREAA